MSKRKRTQKNRQKNKGIIWIRGGLLLIAAALCLTGYNRLESYQAKKRSNEVLETMEKEGVEIAGINLPKDTMKMYSGAEMPKKTIDGKEYIGILEIPSLGLSLPILAQWEEQNAVYAPCRYEGSAYEDNMIIAGHNYRSHFASLKRLDLGAEIYFIDLDGTRFHYIVNSMETIEETNVEGMKSGEWELTLFTCTYGGRQRLTVRCDRVEE